MTRLAEIDTRAAVLLAFIDVEAALRDAANRSVSDSRLHERWRRGASIATIARELNRQGIITDDAVAVLSDLAALRNQVSHDSKVVVTEEAVTKYIEASLEMVRFLDRIAPRPLSSLAPPST